MKLDGYRLQALSWLIIADWCTPSELADVLDCRPQAASAALRWLVSEGLATLSRTPASPGRWGGQHGRRVVYRPTDAGREAIAVVARSRGAHRYSPRA